METLSERHILIFLLQICLLLGCARALGELFRRRGQPAITAEILVGVVFGPTVFGRLFPGWHAWLFPSDRVQHIMLDTVAWLGILLFLLRTGLETSFAAAWRLKGDAAKVAFADLLLPMLIAFVPAFFLPDAVIGGTSSKFMFALFVATIMTISALPVTARVLQDLRIYRTDIGLLIVSALTINDVAGWVVFALILGSVAGKMPGPGAVAMLVLGTLLFAGFCLTAGSRLLDRALGAIRHYRLPDPGASLTLVCLAGLLGGAVTSWIGIHALFGFFIAGIMAGETANLSERTRDIFTQMVHAIFVPIFFAVIGLKLDFLDNFDLPLAVFMLGIGVIGRFAGAWAGCAWARLPRHGWSLVSAAHVPGGEMQIVIGLLALDYGVISQPVFVAIIFGAVVSSMIAGPWMGRAVLRMRRLDWRVSLSSAGILPNLAAGTRAEAIAALSAAAAKLDPALDPEAVRAAVLEREETMGTALEEGIAVPHARLAGGSQPLVLLGRSVRGLDWNSRDGKPAQLIFLILTPAGEAAMQLQILRGIAQAMSAPEKRARLLRAADAPAMLQELCAG